MSSVDFRKCHANSAEGAALLAHAFRHNGKEVNYNNPDVDTSLSYQNTIVMNSNNLGVDDFDGIGLSHEIYKSVKDAVKKIDMEMPPTRIRNDRVILVCHTIAAPADLPPEKEELFFRIVHDEIAKAAGGHQHVTPGVIHRDEIHQYKDRLSGEEKTSRVHMHMGSLPFVKDKGINGKLYETRSRMQQLNRAIDKRCQKELGIRFLVNKKLEPHQKKHSVEDLKRQSESINSLEKRQEFLKAEIAKKQQEVDSLDSYKKELQGDIDELYEEACRLAEKVRKLDKQHKKQHREDRDYRDL